MRNTALLFASLALTVLCWGLYGPSLRTGQDAMADVTGVVARWRPFVCVGLAYFLIGVIVPTLWLHFRGEKGDWTLRGIAWSTAGGALGAFGALGVVLAFAFGGKPIYVMPLIFGGAPAVNALLTIYMSRRTSDVGPMFLAGLIILILGAVVVLVFAPHGPPHAVASTTEADVETAVPTAAEPTAEAAGDASNQRWAVWRWASQLLSVAMTIVCWGSYGPVLHNGQAAMHHSRLRPLVCVGLAYFLIAVVVPNIVLAESPESSTYASFGTVWSLLAGAFGALGALGIILAFNSGGRPVFVMPLVFGGAPVVNTFCTIGLRHEWDQINPFFWAGLILVVAGSVMVLVLAPRGAKSPEPKLDKQEEIEHREAASEGPETAPTATTIEKPTSGTP